MEEATKKIFTVNGCPAFQAVRLIGQGGSSRCYQVRRISEGNVLKRYYVLKEFYPQTLAEYLMPSNESCSAALKPGFEQYQDELDALRRLFLAEPGLCADVNQAAGGGNFPWVFHSERVQGRDDLLLIDTENGYTVADFIKNQRSPAMSAQYVKLCLTITSRLLESLKSVHRGMLHLDVKPQNVYIVTQDERLSPRSAFSIKLLDLASAVKKASMTRDGFEEKHWGWNNSTFSDGYTDPVIMQLCDAVDSGMLSAFWKRNAVDERADWYSVGAVLYAMLTGCDGVYEDQTYLALPHIGILENDAFRSDLEDVLSRALKFSPYLESEIAEHKFLQEINHLLSLIQCYEVMGNSGQPEDKPSASPETKVMGKVDAGKALKENCGLLEALMPEEENEKNQELKRFSPEEQAEYQLQIDVLCRCLPDSGDKLVGYTSHSLPHIREVMEETEKLFNAMNPWLETFIPAGRLDTAMRHLLLAAKFHDTGMAGTPEARQLLEVIDSLYYLVGNSTACRPDRIKTEYARLSAAAKAASMETAWLGAVVHTLPDGGAASQQLKKVLCAYHDEVKKKIRDRHAETSGRYILAHREELSARYGDSYDWAEIALLAALHSNSSRDHIDVKALNGQLSREYCQAFLRTYGTTEDVERLCGNAGLLRIFAEVTILRLADARRSGKNLCMLDGSPVQVEKTPGGRFVLLQVRHGVRETLSFNDSQEILLSEACCNFGDVTLHGSETVGWTVTHEMRVKFCEDETMRHLFRDLRLSVYIDELSSACLEPTKKLRHIFQVEAEGLEPACASSWAESFHLPPGYSIVFQEAEKNR